VIDTVVLICIDDLRFDCMNWQPDQRYWQAVGIATPFATPTLDALARESVLFSKCVSPAGYTPPSHAALFTGTYARTHGVVDFFTTCRRQGVLTISEAFRAMGYETLLLAAEGTAELFCRYNNVLPALERCFYRDAELLGYLRERRPEKVLAVVHIGDVHDPPVASDKSYEDPTGGLDYALYMRIAFGARVGRGPNDVILADGKHLDYGQLQAIPPGQSPEAVLQRLRMNFGAYVYSLEKLDRHRLADLIAGLRAVRRWDRTLLCVVSDHGESQDWFSQWRITHGPRTDETVVRVPFMLKAPGLPPRRIDELVGLIDVFPTLLELCGGCYERLSGPESKLDGRSLLPLIQRRQSNSRDYFLEGWLASADKRRCIDPCPVSRAIRCADGRKYVWNGQPIDWQGLDRMDFEAFAEHTCHRTLGRPVTPWLRERLRQWTGQTSREQVVRELLKQSRPRQMLFDNVDDDLTESRPVVVTDGHPRSDEFERYRERMAAMTARPNPITDRIDADSERKLTEHLRELGYVE